MAKINDVQVIEKNTGEKIQWEQDGYRLSFDDDALSVKVAGVCDPALHVVEVGGALIGSGLNDLAAIDVYHFVEPFCCVIHVSASSFLYAVTSYIGIVILIMVPCPATLLIVLCWYAACSP